jgi:hypothetical protein
MVFDQFFLFQLSIFYNFVLKIFVWLRIRIPIRSGFNNSLDPDSTKYPDPDYVNPDAKNCLNDVKVKQKSVFKINAECCAGTTRR